MIDRVEQRLINLDKRTAFARTEEQIHLQRIIGKQIILLTCRKSRGVAPNT